MVENNPDNQVGNFKEFKRFNQALRYLKKNGVSMARGSHEYNNLKYMFKTLDKDDFAIGTYTTLCPSCGYMGSNEMIACIKRDSKQYKEAKTGEVKTMMCQVCMGLSRILIQGYGFDVDQTKKVMDLVKELKNN